jgi:hypothetical protein
MLRKYKNQIFEKIKELGYDVNLFEFIPDVKDDKRLLLRSTNQELMQEDIVDYIGHKLKIKNTNFEFIIIQHPINEDRFKYSYNHISRKYITENTLVFRPQSTIVDFDAIMKKIENWLNSNNDFLKYEQQPDLWELAKQQNNVLGASLQLADYQSNTENFSPQEQNLFTLALKEFERKLIAEYKPSAEILEKIQMQIADIQVDLKKLSKKSWFDKFSEMYLPNILVSLALSSEARATVWGIFEQSFITVANILLDTGQLLKDFPALPSNF